MKKIVKGNDFTLRIPVMKMVEGASTGFPLPACTDIVVQVCNQFKRIPLAFEIDVKEDNVLLARVEGDKMSLGTYAIEVKGKIFGNDWRSNEYPQFAIVSNNADADTEFGETDEGDNSVEMDTAMVILPPTVELSDLISDTNEALGKVDGAVSKTDEAVKKANDAVSQVNGALEKVQNVDIDIDGTNLNITRPSGEKKEFDLMQLKGDKGERGEQGMKGDTGAQGEQGPQGQKGDPFTYDDFTEAEIKELQKPAIEAATKAQEIFKKAETATTGAEKVNAKLEGNVLTVTNRNGEQKSVNLTDTDEHVTVNCTTTMEGVSMEGLVINVYVNNGADPHQYTTDANGQTEFTITKGATYKVLFPYVQKCNIIDPVQHVASVGNRIIDANYIAETEKMERLTIRMSKADESGNVTPWEGGKAYVTIAGKKTENIMDADGKAVVEIKNGTSYTVSVDKIDGMYEQYDRYSITRTAIADSYRFSFIYRPYESGIWLIDDNNKQWTYDDWEASGNDNSKLMFVRIATLETQRYKGDILISIDKMADYFKVAIKKQWCNKSVEFYSIPEDGLNKNHSNWSRFAYNGLLATQTIIAEGDERGLTTEAADYCYSSTITNGDKLYQGYLPTAYQWNIAWNNMDIVGEVINKKYPDINANKTALSGDKWTSTQSQAWSSYSFNTKAVSFRDGKAQKLLSILFYACLSDSPSLLSLPDEQDESLAQIA